MFIAINDLDPRTAGKHAELLDYLHGFLNSPHPGRDGKVCPFFKKAADSQSVFMKEVRKIEMPRMSDFVEAAVHLLQNQTRVGSVVLTFDFAISNADADKLQEKHKVFCVENNMMIGSLNPDNLSESVRLPGFYPLRSPVPILVIRNMVYTDITFLGSKAPSKKMRRIFLTSYIRNFENSKSTKIQEKLKLAKELLKDAQSWWKF